MTANKPTPGKSHAPGVKCIVSVPLNQEQLDRLELAQTIGGLFGMKKIRHVVQADNGRIVRLRSVVGEYCPVCGAYAGIIKEGIIFWHVESADNVGRFQSEWALHEGSTAIFAQPDLIPLSDEDLEIEIAAETVTGDATDLHVSETAVTETP